MDTNKLNFWLTVIGVAVSVLSIGVAVIIYFLQRAKKSLTYGISTNTRVVPAQSGMQDRVKILLDGQEVQGVRLIELIVKNDGNIPITPSDYETPLTFWFGEKAEILSRAIIEKMPENLDPRLVGEQRNRITIEPLLLNKGDWFIVQLLVTKFQAQVEAEVRVAGIDSITETSYASDAESDIVPTLPILVGWLPFAILVTIVMQSTVPSHPPSGPPGELAYFVLGSVLWVMFVALLSVSSSVVRFFRRLWSK